MSYLITTLALQFSSAAGSSESTWNILLPEKQMRINFCKTYLVCKNESYSSDYLFRLITYLLDHNYKSQTVIVDCH